MEVKIKINVKSIVGDGSVEFKIQRDGEGERATDHWRGPIDVPELTERFEDGKDVWFWWDCLEGNAFLRITVNGTVIFEGDCYHDHDGEVRVKETCDNPTVYKITDTPRIEERITPKDVSFIII